MPEGFNRGTNTTHVPKVKTTEALTEEKRRGEKTRRDRTDELSISYSVHFVFERRFSLVDCFFVSVRWVMFCG